MPSEYFGSLDVHLSECHLLAQAFQIGSLQIHSVVQVALMYSDQTVIHMLVQVATMLQKQSLLMGLVPGAHDQIGLLVDGIDSLIELYFSNLKRHVERRCDQEAVLEEVEGFHSVLVVALLLPPERTSSLSRGGTSFSFHPSSSSSSFWPEHLAVSAVIRGPVDPLVAPLAFELAVLIGALVLPK